MNYYCRHLNLYLKFSLVYLGRLHKSRIALIPLFAFLALLALPLRCLALVYRLVWPQDLLLFPPL